MKTIKKSNGLTGLCIFFLLFGFSCTSSELKIGEAEIASIKDYCRRYTIAALDKVKSTVSSSNQLQVVELIEKSEDQLAFKLSRIFQPSDARISKYFHCEFEIKESNDALHQGFLNLILVKNKAHAEYTQRRKIQVIGIESISISGQVYYIAPKFLKIDGETMHMIKK